MVPACEIREGDAWWQTLRSDTFLDILDRQEAFTEDWVLFHGGLLKVQRSHLQILNDMEMVEVVFNSLGAIEMRPDADTSQNMLDIV